VAAPHAQSSMAVLSGGAGVPKMTAAVDLVAGLVLEEDEEVQHTEVRDLVVRVVSLGDRQSRPDPNPTSRRRGCACASTGWRT
jgi:hypothetical protein